MARWLLAAAALALCACGAVRARDVPEQTAAQRAMLVDAFFDWFRGIGAEAPKITLASFPGMGLGLQAEREVHEGDTLVRVPLQHVLCRDSILTHASMAPIAAELAPLRDDEDLLVTFLVVHRLLGPASPVAPYLAVLPRVVPSTLTWTREQLARLHAPHIAEQAAMRQQQLRRTLHHTLGALIRAAVGNATAGPAPTDLPDAALEPLAIWAKTVVESRALTLRGRKYLTPLADMVNHHPHPRPRRPAGGSHFEAYHQASLAAFEVKADRPAAPGSQVYEDYGDSDNTLYLNHHGFVVEGNPFDCANVVLPPLRAGDRRQAEKALVLRAAGIASPPPTVCVRLLSTTPSWAHTYLHVRSLGAEVLDKACGQTIRAVMGEMGADSARMTQEQGQRLRTCVGSLRASPAKSRQRVLRLLTRQLRRSPASSKADRARMRELEALVARDDAPPAVNMVGIAGEEEEARVVTDRDLEILALRYRLMQKRMLGRIIARFTGSDAAMQGQRQAQQAGGADADGAGAATKADAASAGVRDAAEMKQVLAEFNAWFDSLDATPMHIRAQWVGQGMRVGAVATADIDPEQVYLGVPLDAVMSGDTAWGSPALVPVLQDLRKRFPRGDTFHELLFHLIYEARTNRQQSPWWPYLRSLPSATEMNFPVFWEDGDLALLAGSPVHTTITRNRRDVRNKYAAVKRHVIDAYPDVFLQEHFTEEAYLWAHAVLDSRSIWWDGQRHLVPLLDLINCAEGPDWRRVHATRPSADGRFAITRADRAFPKGSQIFENYGQPNHLYFTYHGFSITPNHHDCAVIEVPVPEPVRLAAVAERNGQEHPSIEPAATDAARRLAQSRLPSAEPLSVCIGVDEAGAVDMDSVDVRRASQYLTAVRPWLAAVLPNYPAAAADDAAWSPARALGHAAREVLRAMSATASIAWDEVLLARWGAAQRTWADDEASAELARWKALSPQVQARRTAAVSFRLGQKRILRAVWTALGDLEAAPGEQDALDEAARAARVEGAVREDL